MTNLNHTEIIDVNGGIVPWIAWGLYAGGAVFGAWIYSDSDSFIEGFNDGEGNNCNQ